MYFCGGPGGWHPAESGLRSIQGGPRGDGSGMRRAALSYIYTYTLGSLVGTVTGSLINNTFLKKWFGAIFWILGALLGFRGFLGGLGGAGPHQGGDVHGASPQNLKGMGEL